MQYENLIVAFDSGVATVTLNRPDVRNAFNEAMIAEVTSVFRALNERHDVRAVVLAANGKAFCAGADLNWMKKMAGYSDDENRADALRLAALLPRDAEAHLSGCERSCAAAHCAPFTLLASAPDHYDLYQRDDTQSGFGQLVARNLTIEAAALALAQRPRSTQDV